MATLPAAVAQAVEEAARESTGQPMAEPEAPTPQNPASAAESRPDVLPPVTSTAPAEGQGPSPEPQLDVPDEYFGVNLSEFSPEQRKEIFLELRKRDQQIAQLHQREAARRRVGETGAERRSDLEPQLDQHSQPMPEERMGEQQGQPQLADDDLMSAFGYSKDDPMYEVKAESVLPLARVVYQMAQMLQDQMAETQVQETLSVFHSTLDKLEKQFGKLPFERETVIEEAVRRQQFDPEALYWSIAGPGRSTIQGEVDRRRQEVQRQLEERRQQAGGMVRPRTSTPASEAPPRGVNVREAIRQVVPSVEQEVGATFEDAVRAENAARGA